MDWENGMKGGVELGKGYGVYNGKKGWSVVT